MITLRPYQSRAINEARKQIVEGKRSILIVAPTGSGKTATASAIVKGRIDKGGRVAWFAHRDELVSQAARTLESFGLEVGCYGANANARVQVMTVQTALSRGEVPEADLVIADEAHHYVADEWRTVIDAYKEKAFLIGLTATPERKDGRAMRPPFESLIVMAQIGELIKEGHLVPCEVYAPDKAITEGVDLAMLPVEAYEKYARGSSGIVFAPHVLAAKTFAAQFVQRGISCGVVHGKMPGDERRDVLARHDAGEISVLCNVYVLTEGYDSPRVKTCILARRIGSPGAYLQMVGRVLRPFTNQETGEIATSARLIDLYGTNVQSHGRPEEERIFSLDGKAIRLASGESFCKVHGTPTPCELCEREAIEQLVPGSLGIPLAKWKEAIRRDDTIARVDRLAKWIAQSRMMRTKDGRPYKVGWAFGKYEGAYGERPTPAIIAASMAKSGGPAPWVR